MTTLCFLSATVTLFNRPIFNSHHRQRKIPQRWPQESFLG